MGDIADWLECIDQDRDDPDWFYKAIQEAKKEAEEIKNDKRGKHECDCWPCLTCGKGF